MITKIKKFLSSSRECRCNVCEEKLERNNLTKIEISRNENSILRLLKGIDDGYLSFGLNRVYVCAKCQTKFNETIARIKNALVDETPIELHYEVIPFKGEKKIWSGWYKSKSVCEDDLRTIARYYKINKVFSIECEISESQEFPEYPFSSWGRSEVVKKLMTPKEYIYRLSGYLPHHPSIL